MQELQDKVVLITGAASGIGSSLALAFAEEGADIVLADIDREGLEDTAREVEERGRKLILVRADVSVPEDVRALAGKVMEEFGIVDVVVNNAGICQVAAIEDLSIQDWERMIGVNLWGPILVVHEFLPQMIKRRSGHIVNVSSGAGLVGFPYMASYTATKFALAGFSEALSAELSAYNIKVTAVCPGVISTPIISRSEIRGFENTDERRKMVLRIGMSPDRAARLIVKAIKRDKPVVILTNPMKILAFLKRLSPRMVRIMGRILARRMRLDKKIMQNKNFS